MKGPLQSIFSLLCVFWSLHSHYFLYSLPRSLLLRGVNSIDTHTHTHTHTHTYIYIYIYIYMRHSLMKIVIVIT